MKWRPNNWDATKVLEGVNMSNVSFSHRYACEAGADAILEAVTPQLETIYSQLCGWRIEIGRTLWYSALDMSIDFLKKLLFPEEEK